MPNHVILASFPSPPQGVWHLGPIPIRAYALCIIAGIIVAIVWGERRFQARGGQKGFITDMAVWAVPFGLVGGRLYHLATDWRTYFGPGGNPIGALEVWNGGLGIWGAIALGGVGAWIGARRRGVPLPAVADAIAPGIVLAQAIGRIGNYFNQELYGRPTDVPWALEIYNRVDPSTGIADPINGIAQGPPTELVHPTFLYELLWNIGVAILVVWADRRFKLGHGRAFALYVAGYTAGRFWIELMRNDEATHVFGVRINVFTAAIVFIGAVIYLIVARKRGPREDLVAIREAYEAGLPDASGEAVDMEVADAEKAEGAAEEAESDTTESEKAEEEAPADEKSEEPKSAEETRVEEAAERKS
ncbi:prolipoprotein diacylglyceryl transferase [Kutzneria buriramensis]|uniref:Phosphatidylglycerol--prolipoprotein diacylglyceryl transferase n=1 Tax=Kutzneria buriramensis TaxID=1045776 RepID=A0A3E0I012_9PSEU|nr:prolipoprotein diacylglyceryl transferase [Kutzneria buriramensis]REH52033.1 prolipoprotein diacylglyceryl transferase [Kutzneria buriramensis]